MFDTELLDHYERTYPDVRISGIPADIHLRLIGSRIGRFAVRPDDAAQQLPPARFHYIAKDVLFINGCYLPHPHRYRVSHQREQLEMMGLTTDEARYEDVSLDLVPYFRAFVFYRCPYTDNIGEFIRQCNIHNKATFFDIDDLVFDELIANSFPAVRSLPSDELSLYIEGVRRMRRTCLLCDYGITTTSVLQEHLTPLVREVFVNRNVASDEMLRLSNAAIAQTKREKDTLRLGYFSGSASHCDDFALIQPALVKMLETHPNVRLVVVGELPVSSFSDTFAGRLDTIPFVDWRLLPGLIAGIDINLAPLTDHVFNAGKSENKWTEASLVGVPTIASSVGAMKDIIGSDCQFGVICSTSSEWENALRQLIVDDSLRRRLGQNARAKALAHHTTASSTHHFATWLESKLARNYVFVSPSSKVSGGVNVLTRHAALLKESGADVTILVKDGGNTNFVVDGIPLNTVSSHYCTLDSRIDTMVASLYTTVPFVNSYYKAGTHKYLVQGYELDFPDPGSQARIAAKSSYNARGIDHITISRWCQSWLQSQFGKLARYAPNGIDTRQFSYKRRDWTSLPLKILIEGDCERPQKGINESFAVIRHLDRRRFQTHYLSYGNAPKTAYDYDFFHGNIPYAMVHEIYQQCHILLKASYFESFSYPPLEMMSTGGIVILAPNDGNAEYTEHGVNCLLYNKDDPSEGATAIEQVVQDEALRRKLIANGIKTARSRSWKRVRQAVLALYQ
jgi:glycosyltransferase involved in cell wall biosynthesis